MNKPVDETALDHIHWWRNVEKVHAQLEGALMIAAEKPELNAYEVDLIAALVERAAAPRIKPPTTIKYLQSLLDTPNCHKILPRCSQEILGQGSLSVTKPVMNQADRFTTLIHGMTAMIRADGIIDEDEEKRLQELRQSDPSLLAGRLIDGQAVAEDRTNIIIRNRMFVLSGSFRFQKSAVEQLIRQAGGHTHRTVTKKVDCLVMADAQSKHWSTSVGGTKAQKALNYGIPIIQEGSLFESLGADH
jgi:NAD-dependent DNA ligase